MLTLNLTEQTWAAPTLIVPESWRIVFEHPTIQVIKTLWMKINLMTMFIIMWSRPLLRCRVERGELYCLRVKYCLIFIFFDPSYFYWHDLFLKSTWIRNRQSTYHFFTFHCFQYGSSDDSDYSCNKSIGSSMNCAMTTAFPQMAIAY
jgi:hypothetical protein